jgi:hypothetical protein
MKHFPFGLPWWLARCLVSIRAYRGHLLKIATVKLVLPGDGTAYYIDGYGDADHRSSMCRCEPRRGYGSSNCPVHRSGE